MAEQHCKKDLSEDEKKVLNMFKYFTKPVALV